MSNNEELTDQLFKEFLKQKTGIAVSDEFIKITLNYLRTRNLLKGTVYKNDSTGEVDIELDPETIKYIDEEFKTHFGLV